MAAVRTPTEFCKAVEARLGWAPPSGPDWKRYQSTASRVAARIATNPELYTWRNLELAIELLAREKKPRTPLGVFAHVQRAADLAAEVEDDLEQQIREATAYEQHRGDPAGWVTRFARATGHYRAQALAEWKASIR